MRTLKRSFNQKKFMFTSGIKWKTVGLFIAVSFAFIGHSQETEKGVFSGIAHAGISTSQIFGDGYGGYNKLGFRGGVGIFTPIKENLSFQFELNFANRGSRKPARPDKGQIYQRKISGDYIDVPLLLKTHIRNFEIEFGLNNAKLVRSSDVQRPFERTSPFPFNRYELGGNVGLYVPLGTTWKFNVRFHQAFSPTGGRLGFVNNYNIYGGAFAHSIYFSLVRVFTPKNSGT